MKFIELILPFWLAITYTQAACLNYYNYLNTNFKLWDRHKGKGLTLGAAESYTHETLGNFIMQKLEVTTDYDSSEEVFIDDDYQMVTVADPSQFVDLYYNMSFVKFASGDIPNKLNSSVDVWTKV